MDTEKIALVLEAIKLGSFSKCADKHLYTSSALLYMADGLENELGIKLIERNFNGIKPTKEGEELLPLLTELTEKANEIKTTAQNLGKTKTNVSLGCYSSVSKTLLPKIILGLKKQFPKINLSIVVGDSVREMAEKGAEIFLVSQTENKDLECIHVYTDKYVAVTNSNNFIGKKTITIKELGEHPFIMSNIFIVKKAFANAKCEVVNITSADDSSVIEMVKNGLGNSILSELSAKMAGKGVKILKLCPEIKREIVLLYHKSDKRPAVKQIIKFLLDKNNI